MSLFPELDAPAPDTKPTASPTEWIHAHCDGGSRGNPGPSGYGASHHRRPAATPSPSSPTSSASAPTTLPSIPACSPSSATRRRAWPSPPEGRLRFASSWSSQDPGQVQGQLRRSQAALGKRPATASRTGFEVLRDRPRAPPQKQGSRRPRQPGHGPRHRQRPRGPNRRVLTTPPKARSRSGRHNGQSSPGRNPGRNPGQTGPRSFRNDAPRLHQRRRRPPPGRSRTPRRSLRQSHPRMTLAATCTPFIVLLR